MDGPGAIRIMGFGPFLLPNKSFVSKDFLAIASFGTESAAFLNEAITAIPCSSSSHNADQTRPCWLRDIKSVRTKTESLLMRN